MGTNLGLERLFTRLAIQRISEVDTPTSGAYFTGHRLVDHITAGVAKAGRLTIAHAAMRAGDFRLQRGFQGRGQSPPEGIRSLRTVIGLLGQGVIEPAFQYGRDVGVELTRWIGRVEGNLGR